MNSSATAPHARTGARTGACTGGLPPASGTPRIAPLTPDRWPSSLHELLDSSRGDGPGRLNLFGTLAHHVPLAEAWLTLARVLTHDGALPARDRELVVLRTAYRLDCAFVHARHAAQAGTAGLDGAETVATSAPLGAHPWPPDDLALLRAVDALADHAEVPEEVWQHLAGRLRPDQLVELLVLAGQSAMMCMTLRTLGTPSDGVEPGQPGRAEPPGAAACEDLPPTAGACPGMSTVTAAAAPREPLRKDR